jgi:hypothetical protein
MITAQEVARALGGRRIADGNYICRCPCSTHKHGDRNPSLSVKDGDSGRLLLQCFSGDAFDDIVKALRAKGLRP